jgi:hypothetical protein
MDDILVGIAKVDGIPQRIDMGKDIGAQVNPQKVGDTNSNTKPTSPTIQVLVFGAILEEGPTSPQSTTCAHKGVGGALNEKLKTYIQSSINGVTIPASTLGKFAKTFSKIELLKMEPDKEIALKMIEHDDYNVKRQLQLAQLFVKVMQQGNGNNPSTS